MIKPFPYVLLFVILVIFTGVKGTSKKDLMDKELVGYIKTFEKDYENLSEYQRSNLMLIAEKTYQFGLSHTAAAVAWQESNFGKWPIDIAGMSCGLFHKVIPNYMKDKNMEVNNFKVNVACSDFINDNDLAIIVFLDDILYWKNSLTKRGYKGAQLLDMMYRSYNAGYRIDNKDSITYSKKVQARVSVLKKKLDLDKKYAHIKVRSYQKGMTLAMN